jgi:membrane-associated phospholipid phosphatase
MSKGIFSRERPFQTILGDSANIEAGFNRSYLHHSFFSGHTSSAFFATGFLNLRIRSTMRQRMNPSQYDNWKWLSSTLLYGWASVVGLSRVHAYKHHVSDVIAGAAAGILLSELFYGIGDENDRLYPASAPMLIHVRIPF